MVGAGQEGNDRVDHPHAHDQALDEALCYGWIDGQVQRLDESSYRQRFAPGRSRSRWSKRNVGIVDRLIAEGRAFVAMLARGETVYPQKRTPGD